MHPIVHQPVKQVEKLPGKLFNVIFLAMFEKIDHKRSGAIWKVRLICYDYPVGELSIQLDH